MTNDSTDSVADVEPNQRRRHFLKMTAASAWMAGLAGCGGNGGGGGGSNSSGADDSSSDNSTTTTEQLTEEEKTGGTVNVALKQTWETLFPMKHAVVPSYYQLFNAVPRLAYYDMEAGEMIGGALESWEYANDAETTLRCTLKEGMTFHKGYGEATAEDAVYLINRVINEGYSSGFVQKFLWPTPPIQEAEVVDEYTFDIHSEQTYVPIIVGNLTNTSLISKAAVEDMGEEQFSQTPVSVGPYEITSSEFGSSATLERFDDGLSATELGYAGPAYADTIEFEVVPDASTRMDLLQTGEIDLVPGVEAQNLEEMENNSSITVTSLPSWNFDWLYVGGESGSQPAREALNNKTVRQAIAYAVDRNSIVENAYFGYGEPDDDMLTDEFAQELYDTTDTDYQDYEIFPNTAQPDQARSMLQDAGYEGLEVEITTSTTSSEVRASQVVVSNLNSAGFNASINQVDGTTLANLEREGDYDILYSSLATLSPDYEQVINYYLPDGDLNSMGYSNPDVTEMIHESRVTTDETERDEIFRDMFETMIEDAPWVYLCHTIDAWGYGQEDGLDREQIAPLAGYFDLTDFYTDT